MRIGLDFDNTIVCYDNAISHLAKEILNVPKDIARTKTGLRDYLRAVGREREWTAFQGELYGPGMRYAEPFEGSIKTMQELEAKGHELVIISHRSRRPYAGEAHDLHCAARRWVADHLNSVGLFIGERAAVNFLETREQKLKHLAETECRAFVDDLPEVLEAKEFPTSTTGILFQPSGINSALAGCQVIKEWDALVSVIAGMD